MKLHLVVRALFGLPTPTRIPMQIRCAVAWAPVLFAQQGFAADPLSQPAAVCAALANDGLATNGWKPSNSMPGEWVCMTALVPFGAPGPNGLANNIAYYVTGKTSTRVSEVIVKINVNNAPFRSEAQWRLEVATAVWFKAMSQSVPPELRAALTNLKPAAVELPFGRAELLADRGGIESFKVVITGTKLQR